MAEATASPAPSQQPTPPTDLIPRPSQPQPTAPSTLNPVPAQPTTSNSDSGGTSRPRDARTIHMLLTSLGVSAYQERVPLQLLDFAFRYTNSVLADAAHLSAEGYTAGRGKTSDNEAVGLAALRLATSSRLSSYQFAGGLGKETMMEAAAERNRIKLPKVDEVVRFGVVLPHERFVMTGAGWNVPETWEADEEEEEEMELETSQANGAALEIDREDVEEEDEIMDDDGVADASSSDHAMT